ncbi:MAG: pirin family protein, partial [Acidobacteriota bacterium]|nr:pirin family protein [Acidobacteriota bacterium]
MINIRKSDERGGGNYGWLDTKYTFSFNTYYDPKFMGFRNL